MLPHPLLSPDGIGQGAPSRPPLLGNALTDAPAPKIQAFSQGISGLKRAEESWKRQSTTPGTGAVHVKSFHCKLGDESLGFLDQQINDWLDSHPQYEVKFVTTAVGEWQGKTREPQMIVQLWL